MMTNTVARPQALGLADVIRVVNDAHSACSASIDHDIVTAGYGLSDEPEPEWSHVHNDLLCLSRHFLTETCQGRQQGAPVLPPRYRLADIFYKALLRLRANSYPPSLGAIPAEALSPRDLFQMIYEQDKFVSDLTQYSAMPAIIAASTLAVKCGAARDTHAGFLINLHKLSGTLSSPAILADRAQTWLSSRKTVCRHGVVFVDMANKFHAENVDKFFNGSVHFLGKAEDARFVICVSLIDDVAPEQDRSFVEADQRLRLGRPALRDVFMGKPSAGTCVSGHVSPLNVIAHPAYVDIKETSDNNIENSGKVISTAAVARRFFGYKGLP